jgi:hypothetical protein
VEEGVVVVYGGEREIERDREREKKGKKGWETGQVRAGFAASGRQGRDGTVACGLLGCTG